MGVRNLGRTALLVVLIGAAGVLDAAEIVTGFTPGPWSRSRPVLSDSGFQLSAALASDDPRYSRVIFATNDGRQITYGLGDTIMPGVVVDAIERDYVVLNRGGKADVVRLRTGSAPPDDIGLKHPEPPLPQIGDQVAGGRVGTVVDYGSVEERLTRMRSGVSAKPPPLAPTSTEPFDLDRRKDSAKLAPLPASKR